MATLIFDAMKGGGSVLWDTTTYCGRPLFADPQAQVFYPPTDLAVYLATFFGLSRLAYILEWELALHVFAAGAFTYALLRLMGISRGAALCGGLVFELGGFFASQTQHVGAIEGATWMPLMWAAVWQLRTTFVAKWFGVLVAAGALSILAGFPAITSTVAASTMIYAGILFAFRKAQLRQILTLLAAIVLAVGCAGIILVPAIQLTLLSVAKYRTDWVDGQGFPLNILLSLVAPPGRDKVCDLIYCGIGGLVLAGIAVFNKRSRGVALPLFCLTILSGIWMFGIGTPFGRAVWAITPDLARGSLYPYYGMAPFCLGVAALAGIGLDRIKYLSDIHKYAVSVIVAADLIIVGSGRPMNANDVRKEPGISRTQIDGSATTLMHLRQLTNGEPPARTDTHEGPVLFSMTAPLTLVPTANGYNPLAIERFIQVRLSFAKGYRWGAWYEVENLSSPVVDALNVRYILTRKQFPIVTNGGPRYLLKAELPGFFVYENQSALPRFWLVHHTLFVRTPEQAFTEIHQPDFAPSKVAVVEVAQSEHDIEARSPDPDTKPAELPDDIVIVRRYDPREIILSVHAEKPAFLVTSEIQYPGWHAWIDSSQVPIFMTNGAFRGLAVPAGDHQIRFGFAPAILLYGACLSALSICAALFLSRRRA